MLPQPQFLIRIGRVIRIGIDAVITIEEGIISDVIIMGVDASIGIASIGIASMGMASIGMAESTTLACSTSLTDVCS